MFVPSGSLTTPSENVTRLLLDAIQDKRDSMLMHAVVQAPLGDHTLRLNDAVGADDADDHEIDADIRGSSEVGGAPKTLAEPPLLRPLLSVDFYSSPQTQIEFHMLTWRGGGGGGGGGGVPEQQGIPRSGVSAFLRDLQQVGNGSPAAMQWLHVNSLEGVAAVATALDLHPLVLHTFASPEVTPSINHLSDDAVLVTATSIYLEAAELHSHKLCMFGRGRHFLLSYETTILTEAAAAAAGVPVSGGSGSGGRRRCKSDLSQDKIFLEALAALLPLSYGTLPSVSGGGGGAEDRGQQDHGQDDEHERNAVQLSAHGVGFLVWLLLEEAAALHEELVARCFARAVRELHAEVSHQGGGLAHRTCLFPTRLSTK